MPATPEVDAQLSELAARAQALRMAGLDVQQQAVTARGNAAVIRGNLGLVNKGIGQADDGVTKSRAHVATRRQILGQASQALGISEEKAEMVAAKAPEFQSKSGEGKAKSGPMASESRELVAKNDANTPDDPEAAAKAREQGGKLNKVGSDIGSTDQAFSRTQTKANELVEDAARAKKLNTQSKGKIDTSEQILGQTEDKLSQMQESNSQAHAEVAGLSEHPARINAIASVLDDQGMSLLAASAQIEEQLHAVQTSYDAGMKSVPPLRPAPPPPPEMEMEAGGGEEEVVQRGRKAARRSTSPADYPPG